MPSAVITGAASGIGLAVARELAASGWLLVGIDRQAAALDELVNEGVLASAVAGDVCDREIHHEATVTASGLTNFTAWIGAAGIVSTYELTAMSEREARRLVDVNQFGVLWGACEAVHEWLATGTSGTAVVITSIHARRAFPNHAVYEMTKAAGEALVRNIAVTYGPQGIRAIAVAPGAVATPPVLASLQSAEDPVAERKRLERQSPAERLAAPEDIASAVAFAVSDRAAYISGTTLTVDGGWTAALSR